MTGKARYTDDYAIAGLLHAKTLINPHAHAKVDIYPEPNSNVADRIKIRKGVLPTCYRLPYKRPLLKIWAFNADIAPQDF